MNIYNLFIYNTYYQINSYNKAFSKSKGKYILLLETIQKEWKLKISARKSFDTIINEIGFNSNNHPHKSFGLCIINSINTINSITTNKIPYSDSDSGYTCGLWQLFHLLINFNNTNPREFMFMIHDFVNYFFSCDECKNNFIRDWNDCKYGRCEASKATEIDNNNEQARNLIIIWLYKII